jgi:hypothetical protein
MGSHLYYYFTPYQEDIEAALQSLRGQEFRAGRYDPAMRQADPPLSMWQFQFPPDESSPAPGPVHATLGDAFFNDAAGADGTGSIIDLLHVKSTPDYCAASPFSEAELQAAFGTAKPSREQIAAQFSLPHGTSIRGHIFTSVERGQGRYIVLYDGDAPSEIFFMGYSFD